MRIIYKPKGKAKEYAKFAINIYNGCTHNCRYCYLTRGYGEKQEKYYEAANPTEDIINRLTQELINLNSHIPEILLSFQGDVYQPDEMKLCLTRQVIVKLVENDLPFTTLTKGGTRATRDFDLLRSFPKARFGTSIVFINQSDADYWEPGAATISNRIAAIEQAHGMGIKTWISLEPVIDPAQAIQIIKELHTIVDHWKIGKINHHKDLESEVDWVQFKTQTTTLLNSLGADYYLKKSLTNL